MNLGVAASRESAAGNGFEDWRRSAETPLRNDGSWGARLGAQRRPDEAAEFTGQGLLGLVAKAARAGFEGEREGGAGMSFADTVKAFSRACRSFGDGAEDADLAFETGFVDGNRDEVFMDIEADG